MIARVLTGMMVAMLVAALVKVLHVITLASFTGLDGPAFIARLMRFAELAALTATQQTLFVLPLALIATALCEVNRVRGLATYALLGVSMALAGFLVQMTGEGPVRTIVNDYAVRAYLIEGFFAGVAYWLVAGRFAGWRRGAALVRARPFPLTHRRQNLSDVEDADAETTGGAKRR